MDLPLSSLLPRPQSAPFKVHIMGASAQVRVMEQMPTVTETRFSPHDSHLGLIIDQATQTALAHQPD